MLNREDFNIDPVQEERPAEVGYHCAVQSESIHNIYNENGYTQALNIVGGCESISASSLGAVDTSDGLLVLE